MVSVIIAALNEEKFLSGLLQDLRKQTFKEFEIVLCDGGSNDATVTIAESYDCIVLKSPVKNQQYQQNYAASQVKSEILMFLDADTRIDDVDFLEKAVQEFLSRSLIEATFFSVFDSEKLKYKLSTLLLSLTALSGEYLFPVAHGGSGIMSLRKFHEKINGFDDGIYLGYDHDYARRMAHYGKTGVLRSTKTITSKRRFEKEGVLNVWMKWAYFALYYLLFGAARRRITTYSMNGGADY